MKKKNIKKGRKSMLSEWKRFNIIKMHTLVHKTINCVRNKCKKLSLEIHGIDYES